MTSRVCRSIATVCLAAGAFGQAPLVAQQTGSKSANLKVTAEVVANCIITTTDVAFGRYDPVVANLTAALDAEGTINVKCTAGTTPKVFFDSGQYSAAGRTRMASGTNRLSYDPWLNASRTLPLLQSGVTMDFQTSDTQHLIVFGRIPGAQDVRIGAYQDTMLITVRF